MQNGKVCVYVCSVCVLIYMSYADNLEFFNEPQSWIDALDFCKERDSTLVHITSQTIQDHVTKLLANHHRRSLGTSMTVFFGVVYLWVRWWA